MPYTSRPRVVRAEITLDEDQLREAGWHPKSECEGMHEVWDCPPYDDQVGDRFTPELKSAVRFWHEQAHPGEHPHPFLCRQEPCRSMPMTLLVDRP